MVEVDLTVEALGLTFKNPVLPAASDIAQDAKTVEKCIKNGVGGIVTKSYTPLAPIRGRFCPSFAFADRLGPEFRSSMLYPGVGQAPYPPERVLKEEMPGMRKLCTEAEIPLIVNLAPTLKVDELVDLAKRFDEAGADAIELNFSANATDWVTWQKMAKEAGLSEEERTFGCAIWRDHFDGAGEMTRMLKQNVNVPVICKLHPYIVNIKETIGRSLDAGANGFTCCDCYAGGAAIDIENECQYFTCWPSGGTSGPPLRPISQAKIILIKAAFPDVYISGAGGIEEAKHAIQYMLIGCPTVQIATAVYYHGYSRFNRVVNGIADWMERKGYSTIKEFLGNALKSYGYPEWGLLEGRIQWVPKDKPFPQVPKIDLDKCIYCGLCQDVCGYDAIEVDKEKKTVKIHEDECWSCGLCVSRCPEDALVLVDRKTGEVIWDNVGQAKIYKVKIPGL